MAITFPVSLASFFSNIGIASCEFDLTEAYETSETGGGEILRADYGPRLWEGMATVKPYTAELAEDVLARIRMLREARATFFVTPIHYPKPRDMLTGPVCTIDALGGDGRSLRLSGLANGSQLRRGDFLTFVYGSGPVRYALHQLVEDALVLGGLTPFFEVIPAIRPGAVVSQTVALSAPFCKAIIVPASFQLGGMAPLITRPGSFRWRQTLR